MPHKESKPGYLSVTQVLDIIPKPWLVRWYGKIGTAECERIKRESQEFGTLVHESIQKALTFDVTSDNLKVASMVNNFKQHFVNLYKVTPVLLEPEEPFVDDRLKLQGTFDAVILIDGVEYIADWKTSSKIDPISVPMQLAAYSHLYGKMMPGVCVRLDKETHDVEVKFYTNLKPYWIHFRNLLKAAHSVKKLQSSKGEV